MATSVVGDGPLVLVVDDDEDVRLLLQTALTGRGYRVITAANGQEGLQHLERELPRLVVLDYWMPVLDGAGFMEEVHRRFTRRPPVILFTAVHDQPLLARNLGVDVYVEKPIELGRFLRLVEATLRGGSLPEPVLPWDSDTERRARPRLHHERAVEVRFPGRRAFVPAALVDVSEGGMGLVASVAPPPWSYVSVALVFADGRRCELDARVKHSEPNGRFGVQFFALDRARQECLSRLLQEIQAPS